MEVIINHKKFDFQSDFKTNKTDWKVKLKDAFRIADIGGTRCFIKRFADPPSALALMERLKGQEVVNMPRVYDIVAENENNKTVHYLFLECIEGNTLKENIIENKPFDTKKIAADILSGLEFTHNSGYWFADLNEENIFCSKNGDYLLIDVDSCWPNEILPDADSAKPGGMPGAAQEYANIVMLFYREILGHPEFLYKDIKGKNLNCLQLLALIAKLTLFLENIKDNNKATYVNKKMYKALHHFLLNRNELYCKNIFTRALNDNLLYSLVLAFSKFIIDGTGTGTEDLPVIKQFKVSEAEIFKGGSIKLLWSVDKAADISVSTSTGNLLQSAPPVSTLNVTPANSETYTLTAVGITGKKVVKSTQVNVTELLKPTIKYFRADKLRVKKSSSVNLSWEVENATRVYINNIGYDLSTSNANIIPPDDTVYTLTAENRAGEKVSSQIDIKVGSVAKWVFIAAAAVLVILCVWQYSLYSAYNDYVRAGDLALDGNNVNLAEGQYVQAKEDNKLLIFKMPKLDDKLDKCTGVRNKISGEDMLKDGYVITPRPPSHGDYVRDTSTALSDFMYAKTYLPDDSIVANRITFCSMVKKASGFKDYQDAVAYGKKTNVPQAALDVVQKSLDSALNKAVDSAIKFFSTPELKFTKDIRIETNTTQDGEIGIKMYFSFELKNLKDSICNFRVGFFTASGDALNSTDDGYHSVDGKLVVYSNLKPGYINAVYDDYSLFIPYNKIHFDASCQGHLMFNGSIFLGNRQIGETSPNYKFDVAYN